MPQYGPTRTGTSGAVVFALVGIGVAVVLVAVVVLSRVGVIDSGPFAKGVPSVPPPSVMPLQAGGLYRLDDDASAYKPDGAKFDWAVAWYLSPDRAAPRPAFGDTLAGCRGGGVAV
jgi:hypothetical protein